MKRILVAGSTGNLGPHIVQALIQKGHSVYALLRPGTINNVDKAKPLIDQGVELIPGNLEDSDSLDKACQGMDVVISCVGGDQLMNQVQLATAALNAGVERFVPSEFGVDPYIAAEGSCDLFDAKKAVQTQIKQSGIGFTPIYTNGFMEFWATGLGQLGHMAPPEAVQVYGDGSVPAMMATLSDIGKYTAAIIDDPDTINQEVLISTTRTSQNDLIDLWQSVSGKTVHKEHIEAEQLEDIINASTSPDEMMTRIFTQLHRSVWIKGEAANERPGVLNAVLRYSEIEPTSLKGYLSQFT